MADFLGENDVFRGGEGRGRGGGRVDISDEAFIQAKREKKRLQCLVFGRNRHVGQDIRAQFYQAVKLVSHIKKQRERRQREGETRGQEKSFSNNFWAFSKKAVNGLIGKEEERPSFGKEFADEWYKNRYSIPVPLAPEALSWFPRLPEGLTQFDMRLIRPRDVKEVLSKKKASSSPGDDGIFYGHLKNLESSHHFLATLFSKTLLSSPSPWEGWGASSIVLIHKAGDVGEPSNFRPIALTSCIGKVFHQILSERICKYLVTNGFIDSQVQKAFIGNLSGCQEHNLLKREIINHAKASKKTAHITWFDLEDAFGSVSHDLIPICLSQMHLPQNVRDYIVSLYGCLRGKIRTSNWISEEFSFDKGVFQGDPLSPIIFLMCFNPIIEDLRKYEESDGYCLDGKSFISLPFADDFNLITRDVRKHKRLMAHLHD